MADDEARLIQAAQRGDAQAWAMLYNRHYGTVYRYCYYRVRDVHLAQDLAAEVFVRMVSKLDTFKVRGRPLLAWLYTIARNLIADYHRHRKQAVLLPLEAAPDVGTDCEDDPSQHVAQRLQADCLASALEHLTEEQRQVILLKFIEGLSNAQVARLLGRSDGAVKSLQHRALKALRRALEKELRYEA